MLLDIEKNIRNCLCLREIFRRFFLFLIKDMQTVNIHSFKFGCKTSINTLEFILLLKKTEHSFPKYHLCHEVTSK